jgi:glycosyltransferase involved in cell wall biosynthesis
MAVSTTEKKITVLFIFHDTNFYSGATRSLLDIIDNYLLNDRIDIVALFPGRQGTAVDYLKSKKVKIVFSYYTSLTALVNEPWLRKVVAFPYRIMRYFISIYRTYRLKDVIKSLNIDIVYTNTSVIFIGGFINKFFDIPHIWHFREYGEEDHQLEFIFGRRYFYRFVNKYADRIVVISQNMYNKYSEKIPIEKLAIIYDDISPIYINPKEHFDYNNKNLQLLIAGTLSEGKGQLEVLKAIKILSDKNYEIKLNIAGSTNCDYYNVLLNYVIENNLSDYVTFHGHVKDMNQLRENMDIGIVASQLEAFGRVTVEGMLSSMVMVGRDCGATSELISAGETGLLYEPNNVNELAERIEYLYNNRKELERIGKNGFRYALDDLTTGRCSDSLLQIMKEIIKIDNKEETIYGNE